jgi:hypothetical protein
MLMFGGVTGFGVGGTPAVGAAVVAGALVFVVPRLCGFFWK